jgi:diguanylate cyclase (GGDEF)-like protein
MNIARFLADSLAGTLDRLAHGNLMTIPEGGTESAIRARELSIATHHAVSLRMSHLAQHDALTDLPNRWLLNERLVRAIALSSRYRRRLAVMFLDLDKFKPINDSLGHAIGDQVLRQISHRLMKCVRVSDTVSRIGGDEFVILLTELEGENNAAACACKIIAAVAEPLEIGPHVLHLGLSIGIGMYPGDGDDAETLIMNADTAMYRSKAEGYGKCHFFNKDVHVDSRERREA